MVSDPLLGFIEQHIVPYLEAKKVDRVQLRSSAQSAILFRDLKLRVDKSAHETVDRLEKMCDRRRQLPKQARLHNWLNLWLCIHLSLSVALLILLVFHVYYALKYF